jgi:hypothetical protein
MRSALGPAGSDHVLPHRTVPVGPTPKLSCKGINKMQRRSRCYHSALDCSNAR